LQLVDWCGLLRELLESRGDGSQLRKAIAAASSFELVGKPREFAPVALVEALFQLGEAVRHFPDKQFHQFLHVRIIAQGGVVTFGHCGHSSPFHIGQTISEHAQRHPRKPACSKIGQGKRLATGAGDRKISKGS
jgi:hypothetical protein